MVPGWAAAASASAKMRSLYSAVKVRRLAAATTSGSGRDGLGGWGATGEAEDIPLFFTLIPVLALLSNYDQENCLINVGTEGPSISVTIQSSTMAGEKQSAVAVRKAHHHNAAVASAADDHHTDGAPLYLNYARKSLRRRLFVGAA